eukprot:CAMPEP_0172863420 /NCGR_PEP_ID=MMETSP1075-20121228/77241_1 /TAXON_ID=2916 /ORGANISM="Ceratium fusus, Strain PA161109" /LENGTH=52 /DNA_ID=CAMNT_0013712021 /DNA_START=100 /DNA_END=254 /DNA_ORIENTATION=-
MHFFPDLQKTAVTAAASAGALLELLNNCLQHAAAPAQCLAAALQFLASLQFL